MFLKTPIPEQLMLNFIMNQLYLMYQKGRVPVFPDLADFTAYYTHRWKDSFPKDLDSQNQSNMFGNCFGIGLVLDPCGDLKQWLEWGLYEKVVNEDLEKRNICFEQNQWSFLGFSTCFLPTLRQHLAGSLHNNMYSIDVIGAIGAVVLTSDMRSFTEYSEKMSPAETAKQLGIYLYSMINVVHDYHGLIDKMVGDKIIAIWKLSSGEDASIVQALNCAMKMQEIIKTLSFGHQAISMGIGLDIGKVFIVRTVIQETQKLSFFGDPLNLTSQYEAETRNLLVPIIVGPSFYNLSPLGIQKFFKPYKNITSADKAMNIYMHVQNKPFEPPSCSL